MSEDRLLTQDEVDELLEVDERYKAVLAILDSAYQQMALGKGKTRHDIDRLPFDQQISPIIQSLGFDYARGQAVKKLHESMFLEPDHAVHELLGAINIIVVCINDIKKKKEKHDNRVRGENDNDT
jgi:hypothetical protein